MQILEQKLILIINDIKDSLKHNLYFSALTLSLTAPDICSYIENPEEANVGKRYKEWLNNYFFTIHDYKIKSPEKDTVLMKAGDVYALRCAYLHNGSQNLKNHKSRSVLNRFKFVHVGQKNKYYHKLYWNYSIQGNKHKALMLDTDTFCNDIIDAMMNFMIINKDITQLNLNAKEIKRVLNTDRIIFFD